MGVQKFVLKLINNNCPELKALIEGPRTEKRVNLCVPVLVVPLKDKKLRLSDAFNAITRELSVTGAGIILDQQLDLDDVILGFRLDGEMTFLRATAKHLSPIGGGFYNLGLEMTEVVYQSDYPQLDTLNF
jgi:hypothetical protein